MSKQKLLIAAGVVSLVMGIGSLSSSLPQPVAGKERAKQPQPVTLPAVCGEKLTGPRIRCDLPKDVEGKLKQKQLYVVQRAADIFSWQEFVALNWPAQPGLRGEPACEGEIGELGPRVWETWKETGEVYLLEGVQPASWNTPEQLPAQCAGTKVLSRRQKVDDEVDLTAQAAKANKTLPATLTDQRGNLVRYEIRMNQVLFDYIVKHKLYDGNVQAKAGAVSYPNGSILIKASWREVRPAEERRYLTVEACICDKLKNHELTNCTARKMGLVGLHIMHKTPSAPQFIWSTFEHVDNVKSPRGVHPSFFNPYCPDCQPNQQTQENVPNQVTRLIPIPSADPNCNDPTAAVDNVHALNQAMQAALAEKKSVLRYYELVNTQWPLCAGDAKQFAPPTVFTAQPALLANTTMETFIQESSSCMGCHSTARTLRTDRFVSSDFSFTLNNAYPKQPTPQIIPPPKQPVTDWDRQNWSSILHGRQLTEQTYELLPQFVPQAKLHCGSCHLSAGGNPTAAWWVGMTVLYAYPQTNDLQKRINSCFTHSLNGNPLWDPESPGQSNPNMNALITYMQWLDEQYGMTKPSGPIPNGFPTIPNKPSGKVAAGQAIFLQKCAFCHGPDGQGRYENNVYFRPALWGPHSFNADAGMANTQLFAEFVKANMPHHSGGLLTDQEARDLAAFVDSRPRPGSYAPPKPAD